MRPPAQSHTPYSHANMKLSIRQRLRRMMSDVEVMARLLY
jgi:hypothetical protein